MSVEAYHVARHVAGQFNRPAGIGFEDVLGFAHIGAAEAVKTYDPSRHAALTTYAHMKARWAIIEGVRSQLGRHGQKRIEKSDIDELADRGLWGGSYSENLGEMAFAPKTYRALRVALDELDEREKRSLVWRFVRDWTLRSIADELGITEGGVCLLIGRVLERLKARLVEMEAA